MTPADEDERAERYQPGRVAPEPSPPAAGDFVAEVGERLTEERKELQERYFRVVRGLEPKWAEWLTYV